MTIAKMMIIWIGFLQLFILAVGTKLGASNNEEDIQSLEHQLQKTIQDIA